MRRNLISFTILSLLVAVAFVVGIGWGAVSIPPAQVVAILLDKIGIQTGWGASAQQAAVLMAIRLPRVLMALVVGSSLAVSGVVLQSIFRNLLAEPAVLGVASGAVTGVVLAIHFGIASFGGWTLVPFAMIGGLVVLLALHRSSRGMARRDGTTLILSGVALSLFLGAVISVITSMSKVPGLRDATFWTMGGLGGTMWPHLNVATPLILLTLIWFWRLGPHLNLLLLGETEAEQLGVDTSRLRLQAMVLIAICTGTGVAFAGNIAFVGLVVPHAIRMILGPDHRILIPASALGGAALLGFGDSLARNMIAPMELPIGVLMTLIGGPLFFYLLNRSRREGAL